MPNYEYGKIYEITGTDENGNKLTYYGSTALFYLSQRLATHIQNFKNDRSCSSKEVLNCPDYRINLVELFPCKCVEELKTRERFYSDNNECVNKHKPILFEGEVKLLGKQYKIDNKEHIQQYQTQYGIDNKEKLTQYRINNKEQITQYKKQYQIDNQEKIKQYRIDNQEQIKQQKKQYYIDNKQQKKQYQGQYNIDNKEHIQQYQRQYNIDKKIKKLEINMMNNEDVNII